MELTREKYIDLVAQGYKKEIIREQYGMTDYSFRKLLKSFGDITEAKPIDCLRVDNASDIEFVKQVSKMDNLTDKHFAVYGRVVKSDKYQGVAVAEIDSDALQVVFITECQERARNYPIYMNLMKSLEQVATDEKLNGITVNLGQDKIDMVLKKMNYRTVSVCGNNYAVKPFNANCDYINTLIKQQKIEEQTIKANHHNSDEYKDKHELAIDKRREGYKAWQAQYWHDKAKVEAEEQEKLRLKNERKEQARLAKIEEQRLADIEIAKTIIGVEHYVEREPYEKNYKRRSLINTPENRANIYKLCKLNKDNPQALDYLWRHATRENFVELLKEKFLELFEIKELFGVDAAVFKARMRQLGIVKKNMFDNIGNIMSDYDISNGVVEMKLQYKYFKQIKQGTKTFEYRLNDNKRKLIGVGTTIIFSNDKNNDTIICRVTDRVEADTFKDFYSYPPTAEELKTQFASQEKFISTLSNFYTPKQEMVYGVVAIGLKRIGKKWLI